jgi:YD repeat-containing protein
MPTLSRNMTWRQLRDGVGSATAVIMALASLVLHTGIAQATDFHFQWTDGFLGEQAPTPRVEIIGSSLGGGGNIGVFSMAVTGTSGIPGRPEAGGDGRPEPVRGMGKGASDDPGKPQRAEPVPTDNSRLEGCSDASSGAAPTTKNPVVISSGEKIKQETDFLAFGQYGLSHQRTYRRNYPGSGMFGAYWWSSLSHPKLKTSGCFQSPDWGCLPTAVQVWKPDASGDVYQHVAGTDGPAVYSAVGSAAGGTLQFYPNLKWELTRERMTYTYSAAGYLKSISGPMGLWISFTYSTTTPSQLNKVTNRVGQSVTFTWLDGHVVSVTDPSGAVWQYTYNTLGLLETVTSPGTVPDVRRYHYDSPVSPSLLTGISINGVRYSTYAYDSAYRTKESGLAGGEERDTFVYGTNTTTVTSATGQATTYTFA